jgi:hypothetical protein
LDHLNRARNIFAVVSDYFYYQPPSAFHTFVVCIGIFLLCFPNPHLQKLTLFDVYLKLGFFANIENFLEVGSNAHILELTTCCDKAG